MATEAAVAEDRAHGTLRRELRFWEAIALSIGIMAPTAAMALNGVAPAGLVGRAVPLAFLFAAIAIAFVSYAFIRLTRHFNHAGSAYATVSLSSSPGVIEVSVRDDGRGFDPGAPASGFGLVGMRERAALLGGRVEVTSALGEGTTVRAVLPRSRAQQ